MSPKRPGIPQAPRHTRFDDQGRPWHRATVQMPIDLWQRVVENASRRTTSAGVKMRQWIEEGLMRDEGDVEDDYIAMIAKLRMENEALRQQRTP